MTTTTTTHTLLMVDDDPNLLMSLRRSLRGEGYEFLCAVSPEEAFGILSKRRVSLIISDQAMPGMTGTEFLTRVHRMYPDVIGFILTGHASLDVALQAINTGAVRRFFVKPCDTNDLAVAIREALAQHALLVEAHKIVQKQQIKDLARQVMEQQHPGITQIQRDADGTIIFELPDD